MCQVPAARQVFFDLSKAETGEADDLISRVLLFHGHPNVQKLNAIQVSKNAKEMLRLSLEGDDRRGAVQRRGPRVPRPR